MTDKDRMCSVEGCQKKAKKDGTKCSAHYMSAQRAAKKAKTEPASSEKPASSDDALINDIIGGKPIVSPPDKPKEAAKDKDGKDKPKEGQAALPAFPPSLWMMLGSLLNKALKTKAYELDDASAKYLSDSLTLMLQEQNVKMSPTYAFVIAIGMWLGLGTVQMMLEKGNDPKNDKTPEQGILGGAKQWFQRNKVTPVIADFVAAEQPSPQQETVMVAMPAEEERLRNLQQPIPVSEPTKVKRIDLKAMEELSRKEMAKVTEELRKKKDSVLAGLSR